MLAAGTDYVINLVLRGTVATVTVAGSVLGSHAFNGVVVDGQVGMVSRNGVTSYDRLRLRTDDPWFPVSQPEPEVRIGDAALAEGSTGQVAVAITLTRTGSLTSAATVSWSTYDGTAVAGSDYVGAAGTATFAAGSSTTTIRVYLKGDTTYENNETFGVRVQPVSGYNLADGFATVTITNDDAKPTRTASPTLSPSSTTTVTAEFTTTETTVDGRAKKGTFTATINSVTGAVTFAITGAPKNASALAIRISCDNSYATVVNVPLVNGSGTSQTVYPGAGECMAVLEDPMAIGRSKMLGSLTFAL